MDRVAITYRRVSTDRQATEGQSLSAQHETVKDYCKLRGWRVARHFEDAGKSARSRDKRPGLEAAIRLACERKGVLVAYSLSRLARSVIDASAILRELREAGADLAVVDMAMDTSTASGELIFNIFSAIAQFESQQTGERIRMANQRIVDNNGYRTMGAQPAGWRYDKKLRRRVRVEKEWEIISQVERLMIETKSQAKTARSMRLLGLPTISELRGQEDEAGWTDDKVDSLMKSLKRQRDGGWIPPLELPANESA